ncbi:MAG TPA: DUF485 domain-containing protein [Pirellulales bacterium]|jgi:uncharacterized membrane protein (DUF485 family)|nr:DUF485 domain-containing protein [Pirellulales bacterium]
MSQPSHAPAVQTPIDRHNARWGLVLFAVYVALYVGFMILAAFAPDQMAKPTAIAGLNLAIVYGIGLIVAALVLAFIYSLVSKSPDSPH